MGITSLTFNVTDIPQLRKRDTVINFPADQDDFVDKFEANNDHLAIVTVPQLNTMKNQLNVFKTEVEDERVTMTNLSSNATTQANKATTEATKASLAAVSATQMRNETAGLIELLPSDVNLAYTKAAIDSKLGDRDLANFLNFKF